MAETADPRLTGCRRLAALVLLLLTAATIGSAGVVAQDPWLTRISDALDRMASSHYQPELRAAYGAFTYSYTGLGSSFSRFVEEALTRAITGSKRVKLFARRAIQAMDASYRELYRDYFQTAEADALLYGRFSAAEGGSATGVMLHLEMASLSTGELLGAEDLLIPAAAVPPGVSLTPPGLVQAQNLRSALTDVLAAAGGNLVVQAVSDRGDNPVYRMGENLQLHVFLNRDAYLKVYHVDMNGRTQLIYPNRFHPDNKVAGGAFVRIPEQRDPFQFRLGPPFGTEFIKVIASTRQFSDVESAFSPLEGTARQAVTRGLALIAADAESAETLMAYTIVEK
jgi:hypothetical protein